MDKYKILKEYFGYSRFRDGQEEIIDSILAGKNALAVMPTGAGKSICFQVPALIFSGITIVVSPLISLMKDQVESLIQNGIKAAYINSSMTYRQIQRVLYNASYDMYKIIYVAPERLCSEDFLTFAKNTNISMLTVDEAHCISQWGTDFRPSYLKIADFYDALPNKPIISAFTATATNEVKADIIYMLRMKEPFVLTTGFDRSNLKFSVLHPEDKFTALTDILNRNTGKCGIIYCNTRKNVDSVYEQLCGKGYTCSCYHAGMDDISRKNNQDDFLYDKKNIMVATNAFGMGIDKSNVSFVVHYNMPKDMESYYQEAGRAGRDGEPAECVILYSKGDVRTNQFIIENGDNESALDETEREELRIRDMERLKKMTFYCNITECLRHYILDYFGEESEHYCGNCENCLKNYEDIDITVDSQKILSCIIRVKQNYGANMIINILRGSKSERILRLGMNKLSTYGIMRDKKSDYIYEVINYLEYSGYIFSTKEQYPVLKVTEKSRGLLKGEVRISMRTAHKEPEKDKALNIAQIQTNELFLELRKLRTTIALEQNLPSYIIFSDAALNDMCRKLPQNEKEFLEVSGVGEKKLELYGKYFINAINDYIALNNIPSKSENPIVRLLKQAGEHIDSVKTENKITITQFCKNIMEPSDLSSGINKVRDAIVKWLIENEFLREEKNYKGTISKRSGRTAADIGIEEEEKESQYGEKYYNIYYSESAQRYILDNFNSIIDYHEKNIL